MRQHAGQPTSATQNARILANAATTHAKHVHSANTHNTCGPTGPVRAVDDMYVQ